MQQHRANLAAAMGKQKKQERVNMPTWTPNNICLTVMEGFQPSSCRPAQHSTAVIRAGARMSQQTKRTPHAQGPNHGMKLKHMRHSLLSPSASAHHYRQDLYPEIIHKPLASQVLPNSSWLGQSLQQCCPCWSGWAPQRCTHNCASVCLHLAAVPSALSRRLWLRQHAVLPTSFNMLRQTVPDG